MPPGFIRCHSIRGHRFWMQTFNSVPLFEAFKVIGVNNDTGEYLFENHRTKFQYPVKAAWLSQVGMRPMGFQGGKSSASV